MKKRCGETFERFFPDLTEDQRQSYYVFAKRLKMAMLNYINLDKLSDAWLFPHPEQELNYKILRTICRYFMREQQVISILTSKKMPQGAKLQHLKTRRQLMSFIYSKGA
jgi:hypothetical protein